MEKQVLSIEQMQELIELGIDTSNSSMCWYKEYKEDDWNTGIVCRKADADECYVPTFTLQDILSIVPCTVKIGKEEGYFSLTNQNDTWLSGYNKNSFEGYYPLIEHCGDSPLEAAFNMLKWCKENNYI